MDFGELLKNDDVQKQVKNLTASIGSMVYNEIYVYIWFICIYSIFLFFIAGVNLYLLIKLVSANSRAQLACDS